MILMNRCVNKNSVGLLKTAALKPNQQLFIYTHAHTHTHTHINIYVYVVTCKGNIIILIFNFKSNYCSSFVLNNLFFLSLSPSYIAYREKKKKQQNKI